MERLLVNPGCCNPLSSRHPSHLRRCGVLGRILGSVARARNRDVVLGPIRGPSIVGGCKTYLDSVNYCPVNPKCELKAEDLPMAKYSNRPISPHQKINLMKPQNPQPPLLFPCSPGPESSPEDPLPSLGHASGDDHWSEMVPGP